MAPSTATISPIPVSSLSISGPKARGAVDLAMKNNKLLMFLAEAREVDFARQSVFSGVSFKLDYLTKPSFFQDLGIFEKVKMVDRVKPEDEVFLVAYPYFNAMVDPNFVHFYIDTSKECFMTAIPFCFGNACCGRTLQRGCLEHCKEIDHF